MTTSWKTTLGGALAGLGMTLLGAGAMDWLPADHKRILMEIGFALSAIGPFFTGLFARDNNVTSEQANAIKPPGPMLPMLAAAAMLSAGLVLGSGCASNKLELGGAYAPAVTNAATGEVSAAAAPDLALFIVDSSFDLAYTALDTVFTLERQNRALLWKVSPKIKQDLDAIRPTAVKVKLKYATARKAYLLNPIPANLTPLQTALAELQKINTAAGALLPASSAAALTTKTPPPLPL